MSLLSSFVCLLVHSKSLHWLYSFIAQPSSSTLFFAPHVADCTGIIDPEGTPSDDCTSTYTMSVVLTRVLQYSIAARNCAQSCIAGGKSTLLVKLGKGLVRSGSGTRRRKGEKERGRDPVPAKPRTCEGSRNGRNGRFDAWNADRERGESGVVVPWVQ